MQFWPARPLTLAKLLHEYTLGSEQVARRVLEAMARALGFGEEFFLGHVGEKVATYARFTYYPPCPRPDLVYGMKPHTDNSVVTVLLLDRDVGGLQVLKDGQWVDVPVLGRSELLVVVGEEMETMSNAVFRAPMHRPPRAPRGLGLVQVLEQEIQRREGAEEWLRAAKQAAEELRERAEKDALEHAAELWKHKDQEMLVREVKMWKAWRKQADFLKIRPRCCSVASTTSSSTSRLDMSALIIKLLGAMPNAWLGFVIESLI